MNPLSARSIEDSHGSVVGVLRIMFPFCTFILHDLANSVTLSDVSSASTARTHLSYLLFYGLL